MKNRRRRILATLAAGLVLGNVAYSQNNLVFTEIFSTADGSVQFINAYLGSSVTGDLLELPVLAGQTLVASDGKAEHRFTFTSNVTRYSECSGSGDSSSCNAYALIATQGFADLHLVKPDFVVPNGFLFLPGGSLQLGVSQVRYAWLPVDGFHALGSWSDSLETIQAVAYNNAGELYMFIKDDGIPEGVNPLVEYYNAELDDYFLTGYPAEIQSLDLAGSSGWQRTGHSFSAWTSNFSGNAAVPANLAAVCRIWLGNSHFYSNAPGECSQVAVHRGVVLESQAAFFATQPTATGDCPAGQARLYRLWNARGSGHRYTTEAVVRDAMRARGWIAEGYGTESVAMCVGGSG